MHSLLIFTFADAGCHDDVIALHTCRRRHVAYAAGHGAHFKPQVDTW